MTKTQLKQLIKECAQEIFNEEAGYPEQSSYGKHNAYEGEFSQDYINLYKLEKAINRLPRKIGKRSVSALFVDKSKPFELKNPSVEIKFQVGSVTTKIFMTLKEWNKNCDRFVLAKQSEKTKIKLPDILLTKQPTTQEILESISNWLRGDVSGNYTKYFDDDLTDGGSGGEW